MKKMKRIFTLCVALCTLLTGFAQTDTTGKQNPSPKDDTIRIGGMIIIRKAGSKEREIVKDKEYKMKNRRGEKPSNLTTNWWIFDLGFSNYQDNTNYGSTAAQAYAPGSNASWFDLKDSKSRNVNVWFFMQKLNVVKHVVNLKYGLGLELNNYRFEQHIRYLENTTAIPDPPRVILDGTAGRSYEKDKLAADYITVPMMINFNFTPNRKKGFGLSAGISAGYLYSARNKTVTSDEKKKKAKDDFELERWKLSYIAELALGPVRFYGSYAFKSMYERGLDVKPYNFGFRFSNW
ncbi:MAG: outer membrane beta-barrel protein [Chitinophagaceae bacterium]|nr:outer membrane beta-barrel protein [Chitinophagaceae bacterium]